MLIILIILLTIMNLALKLSAMGVELSYQVGRRANDIRRKNGEIVQPTESKFTKKALGIATRTTVKGVKSTIKLLSFVVSLIRNILIFLAGLVLIIDIIVFFIIITVVSAYLLLFQ